MYVYEARRDDQAFGVYDCVRSFDAYFPNFYNSPLRDSDVRFEPWVSCPIYHKTILDQQIMNQNKVTFVALSNRDMHKYFPQECFEEPASYEKLLD